MSLDFIGVWRTLNGKLVRVEYKDQHGFWHGYLLGSESLERMAWNKSGNGFTYGDNLKERVREGSAEGAQHA